MSEVDYSYIPPEQAFVNDEGMFEVIAPALLSDRVLNDKLWNEQRIASRQDNLEKAKGVWYKGIYRP